MFDYNMLVCKSLLINASAKLINANVILSTSYTTDESSLGVVLFSDQLVSVPLLYSRKQCNSQKVLNIFSTFICIHLAKAFNQRDLQKRMRFVNNICSIQFHIYKTRSGNMIQRRGEMHRFKVVQWLSADRKGIFSCFMEVVMISVVQVKVCSSFHQRGAERVKGLERGFVTSSEGTVKSCTITSSVRPELNTDRFTVITSAYSRTLDM